MRKALEFQTGATNLTSFYSTSPPEELFDVLAVFASKQTKDIWISPEIYKMKLCFTRKNKMDDKAVDKVKFTVKVLQVPEQEKWCVEFKRKSGDVLAFNKVFNDAKFFFGGHVNATL